MSSVVTTAANGFSLIPPARRASVITTAMSVASRTVRKYMRTPQLIIFGTMNSLLWLVIFRYVLGGAMDAGQVSYVNYFVPGYVMGYGVLYEGMTASAGVAEDVEHGFFDRLRSLPVSRAALLAGRALANTAVIVYGLLISVGLGFLFGFRLEGELSEALLALGLCVVYGFAFTWLFVCIGLAAGTAQGAQGMAMPFFLLWFVSSAFVPTESLPNWLESVANNQPLTSMFDSVRALALGDPALAGLSESTAHYVVLSLVWSAGLMLLFAPLAVARYRRG
jgi:ABC-2 type transport system permease protein